MVFRLPLSQCKKEDKWLRVVMHEMLDILILARWFLQSVRAEELASLLWTKEAEGTHTAFMVTLHDGTGCCTIPLVRYCMYPSCKLILQYCGILQYRYPASWLTATGCNP